MGIQYIEILISFFYDKCRSVYKMGGKKYFVVIQRVG